MKYPALCKWISALTFTLCLSAASAHDHTHIGRNQDNQWGTADDNKLWIFATGSAPQWPVIELFPTGDWIGDKQIYQAELDCWLTAHPAHGGWQLGGTDSTQMPDWRISLKRISFSDSENFRMQDHLTSAQILAEDGAAFAFGNPFWMSDKLNENGQAGAWGIHYHLHFLAAAAGAGEYFTAVFTVFDTGSTGFLESDPYTFTFVTVPEPASLILMAAGGLAFVNRRRETTQ